MEQLKELSLSETDQTRLDVAGYAVKDKEQQSWTREWGRYTHMHTHARTHA